MFHHYPVNRLNQTDDEPEMMFSSGIVVECHPSLGLIRRPIEGLTRLGKDWTLMLQSYLILSNKLLHKDQIQTLTNPDHHSPLCVLCVGS